MQFNKIISLTGLALGVSLAVNVFADKHDHQHEMATAAEVVAKVQAAAKAIAADADTALGEMMQDGKWVADNKWVWGGTYVFVYDCKANKAVAHPTLAVAGKTIMDIKDKAGKKLFEELCTAGDKAMGGWVSYMWPKPGATEPSQKVSYALAVEGTPYQVSAGVYDDAADVKKLDKMLSK